jgi:signal transduction histidine kinase
MMRFLEVYDDPRRWVRHGARVATALALTALAISATALALRSMGEAHIFPIFPAVATAALLGGTACGVLTAVFTVVAFTRSYLDPIHWVWVSWAPAQERVLGILASGIFVAVLAGGLRRAYRRADAARQRAEAAEREARLLTETQERVMAILGHDLRTPLSAIIMAAEVLRRTAHVTEQQRSIDRIAASAGRMARMVQDILDVARARHGLGMNVAHERVPLDDLCRSAVEELRHARP